MHSLGTGFTKGLEILCPLNPFFPWETRRLDVFAHRPLTPPQTTNSGTEHFLGLSLCLMCFRYIKESDFKWKKNTTQHMNRHKRLEFYRKVGPVNFSLDKDLRNHLFTSLLLSLITHLKPRVEATCSRSHSSLVAMAESGQSPDLSSATGPMASLS